MANPTKKTFEDDLQPPPRRSVSRVNAIPAPIANASQPIEKGNTAVLSRILKVVVNPYWEDETMLQWLEWFIENPDTKFLDGLAPFRVATERDLMSFHRTSIESYLDAVKNAVIVSYSAGDKRLAPLLQLFDYKDADLNKAQFFDERTFKDVETILIPPLGARVIQILRPHLINTATGETVRRGKAVVGMENVLTDLEDRIGGKIEVEIRKAEEKFGFEFRHVSNAIQKAIDTAVEKVRGIYEERLTKYEKRISALESKNLELNRVSEIQSRAATLKFSSPHPDDIRSIFDFLIEALPVVLPSAKDTFRGKTAEYAVPNSQSLGRDFDVLRRVAEQLNNRTEFFDWLDRRRMGALDSSSVDTMEGLLAGYEALRGIPKDVSEWPEVAEVSTALKPECPAGNVKKLLARMDKLINTVSDEKISERLKQIRTAFEKLKDDQREHARATAASFPTDGDWQAVAAWWNGAFLCYLGLTYPDASFEPLALPDASSETLDALLAVFGTTLGWKPPEKGLLAPHNAFIDALNRKIYTRLFNEANAPYSALKWTLCEAHAVAYSQHLGLVWSSSDPDDSVDAADSCAHLLARFQKRRALRIAEDAPLWNLHTLYLQKMAADLMDCVSSVPVEKPAQLRGRYTAINVLAQDKEVRAPSMEFQPQFDADGEITFDSALAALDEVRSAGSSTGSGVCDATLTEPLDALAKALLVYCQKNPELQPWARLHKNASDALDTLVQTEKLEMQRKVAATELTKWNALFAEANPKNLYHRDCAVKLADLYDRLFEVAEDGTPVTASVARQFAKPLEEFLNKMSVFRDMDLAVGRYFNRLSGNLKSVSRIRKKPPQFHPDQVTVSKIVRNRWYRRKNNVDETICEASYDVE